ncbi:MAG: DNA mismatch repair protein MutS [Candidatus Fluviicola riflensis]|nr:MAG: DNA mismatch repair protein MutS [Candidatus Fluviicola riflensis]OGS77364.1 MAG: DNA mismatch repair protein MutS [Candidatus Fluviicola riflensis]OGS83944.1 MAG: DNA mismatch repair protein MutS [Fluviicola sp. RIFCSPHIGHO2_12_FULL_43_24]OGS84431.1 MAG: DNA mismatch repair protein MutS [Fluviicola sp. RIFCSPHIGHO2_01_FULL_43_53]
MAKKEKTGAETPLMKQYNEIKARHPQALLLFRVGDFYETFGSDAVLASRVLGIVLTKRGAGSASETELAGFPHHSLDAYLPKLVRAGHRVAICDQLEDPKMTKTIVKRGVTELVTPGISFSDKVLNGHKNNFLAAIHFDQNIHGVAFMDITTGEFFTAQGSLDYVGKLIQGFEPSEIVFQKNKHKLFDETFGQRYYTFRLEDWVFTPDFAQERLTNQFQTNSLKGFGIEDLKHGVIAAGAILHYLNDTQHDRLGHITQIQRIEEEKYVWLDRFTIRNLELVAPLNEGGKTLFDVINATQTPMGDRLLKRWIVMPLKQTEQINHRLGAVEELTANTQLLFEVDQELSVIGDLERLVSKVAVGRISPKEVRVLAAILKHIDPLKFLTASVSDKKGLLHQLFNRLESCEQFIELVEKTIQEDAPIALGKGPVIANGINAELDELRGISGTGKDFLETIQNRESERTGIPSLKIAFNNVFGYYLEVRNTHKDKVPEEWIRKQTLVNAERYITPELKEYETKILGAEDRIAVIESRIYGELIQQLAQFVTPIQQNAHLIAQLDCLCGFAHVATRNQYSRPVVNDGFALSITEGRHPVIEGQLKAGEQYVPNDVYLDKETQQIIMITGPNMAGKSALLRQTALIVLLAQMGSFVPATAAEIGIIDKVFTRVGASDNISSGESTFMVEMNETSSILNNLSDRSLILLDEIGRGTSTYDGISIAWAIAEYLHEHPTAKGKTLFATHYHELNDMEEAFPRIHNFNVSVKEVGQKIIFLRKLVRGGSEHSFGIHVAKLAGMPKQVVERAELMLQQLELNHASAEAVLESKSKKGKKNGVAEVSTDNMQLSFFQLNDPVLEQIHDELVTIDINTLTPVEALMKLNEIKKLTGG